jgi:prenyl protein peptidase
MDHRLPLYRVVLYSLSFTVSYVGVLYLSKTTRPSRGRGRDDLEVIKARMLTVSVLTLVLVFAVVPAILIWENIYHNYYYAWLSLHIKPGIYHTIIDPLQCLLVTATLYSGPLIKYVVFEHNLKWKQIFNDIKSGTKDIYGVRNYLVGPLTEELVFRACILAIHLASHVSRFTLIYVTPLYFGIAHLHHAYENYIHDMNPQVVIFTALFQFSFTTLFGWFASYIYLRTGSVWSPLAVHIFCNSLGLPEWSLDNARNTAVYRTLLVLGLICFSLLVPIIDSPNRIL